jgi:hypothetical protein
MNQESRIILQAIGTFWGSTFSCLAFVMPRMLEVRKSKTMPSDLSTNTWSRQFDLRPSDSQRFQILVPRQLSNYNHDPSGEYAARSRRSSGSMAMPQKSEQQQDQTLVPDEHPLYTIQSEQEVDLSEKKLSRSEKSDFEIVFETDHEANFIRTCLDTNDPGSIEETDKD